MKINNKGLNIIKEFEGLKLRAYKCPAGIWTIGYGHTSSLDVREGLLITEKEAEALLRRDVKDAENGVDKILSKIGVTFNANQFSACVSLAYNIGVNRFASSSIISHASQHNNELAADSFLKYVYSGKVKLNGLVRRRDAERALFLT